MERRVLVVEDNADTRTFLSQVLKAGGYRVDQAEDGAAALVSVQGFRYDLILTDIEMPRMDGVDAARAVRALELEQKREPTPIVALTAQDHPEMRERATAAGMNAFLAKPVRSRELLDAVASWIDARMTVLVVDDDDQSRALATTWLQSAADTRVLEASRAGAAIAAVKRERIDLVLLDMVMPGIDGYAAARLLRALPDGAKLPIVAVTAHAGDDEKNKCLAAGCSEHLPKPVQKPALLALLARHRPAAPGKKAPAANIPAEQPSALRVRSPQAPPPSVATPAAPQFVTEAEIDPDAAALLPTFLGNRAADLVTLRTALEARDFATITRLGHNLRGSGGSYGFPTMSEIGAQLEDAGKLSDASTIARAILRLERELTRAVAQRARG